MGADLYIRSIHDKANAEHMPKFNTAAKVRDALIEAKVDQSEIDLAQEVVTKHYDAMYDHGGYFRDSYNSTSLFWQLGLSWWGDTASYINSNGKIVPSKAKLLLEWLKSRTLAVPTLDSLKGAKVSLDPNSEDSLQAWHEFFIAKKKRFEDFIQTAIDLNEPIDCSI